MSRPEKLLECEDEEFSDEVFEEYKEHIEIANLLVKTHHLPFFALTENAYDIDLANEWLRSVNDTGKLAYYLYNLPEDKFDAIGNTLISLVIKRGILL